MIAHPPAGRVAEAGRLDGRFVRRRSSSRGWRLAARHRQWRVPSESQRRRAAVMAQARAIPIAQPMINPCSNHGQIVVESSRSAGASALSPSSPLAQIRLGSVGARRSAPGLGDDGPSSQRLGPPLRHRPQAARSPAREQQSTKGGGAFALAHRFPGPRALLASRVFPRAHGAAGCPLTRGLHARASPSQCGSSNRAMCPRSRPALY